MERHLQRRRHSRDRLALRPDLTKRGLGRGFLEAGLEFLVRRYDYRHPYVCLTLDPRNEPALKLYHRAGLSRYRP